MTLAKTDKRRGEPNERRVSIRIRVKPSVKAMAERLAQKDARSMAEWLEGLIAAEAARPATKRSVVRRAQ
jgi:predicted HicB family RNase H-like nuclease